jgi:hypothetical protein
MKPFAWLFLGLLIGVSIPTQGYYVNEPTQGYHPPTCPPNFTPHFYGIVMDGLVNKPIYECRFMDGAPNVGYTFQNFSNNA